MLRESQENKNLGVRCMTIDAIRAESDEIESRKFLLSFSSEDPYWRWFGFEILDHTEGAMNLERLNSIGVLLFNHDTDRVCGKILRAWLEDGRCYADVEFDTDDAAELIYQKVKSGTLKATSVRYSVEEWEEVKDKKKSEDGRFEGPCWIAKKWTPLEVSIVSVPADPTVGVGRAHEEPAPEIEKAKRGISINELQLRLNLLT